MNLITTVAIFGLLWTAVTSRDVSSNSVHCGTECCLGFVPKVSMESVNYPGRFWRHCSSLGFIDNNQLGNKFCNPSVYHGDVTFLMLQPGLAGGNDTVSFQSDNYPGYFLRHSGYRMRIDLVDGSDLFKKDATFTMLSGKARGYGGNTFRSVNYPDYYIRQCSNKLFINNNDGTNKDCDPLLDSFLRDMTFTLTTGMAALK